MLLITPPKNLSEKEREFHRIRVGAGGDVKTIFDSILNDMHALDAKSSALLTFISVALAALAFSLSLVDGKLEYSAFIKSGVVFFIGLFAIAARFSLRCLEMYGPTFGMDCADAASYELRAIEELSKRRYNYFVSLQITKAAFTGLIPFVALWLGLVAREMY